MYKVFIYDKPVYLCSDPNFTLKNYQQLEGVVIDKIFDILQSNQNEGLIVYVDHVASAWEFFKSNFIFIQAAGGLVSNKEGQYLFIYRLGKWDLPKGKLEESEDITECAIREVEEECAISDLQIIKELPSTYHCYPYKNTWVLKQTHWYQMYSDYAGNLHPQIEEGIEKVEWLNKSELSSVLQNTYLSIKEVLLEIKD